MLDSSSLFNCKAMLICFSVLMLLWIRNLVPCSQQWIMWNSRGWLLLWRRKLLYTMFQEFSPLICPYLMNIWCYIFCPLEWNVVWKKNAFIYKKISNIEGLENIWKRQTFSCHNYNNCIICGNCTRHSKMKHQFSILIRSQLIPLFSQKVIAI